MCLIAPALVAEVGIAATTEVGTAAATEVGTEAATEVGTETATEVGTEVAKEVVAESPLEKIPSQVEDIFAPENFSEEAVNLASDVEHNEMALDTPERTSTFEQQTIDNFKLEEMRPEIESQLHLGEEHSGPILRENLEQVTGMNPEMSNAHHIVGNDTPVAAKKLEEFGIDRNDPANGIFLPDSPDSSLKGAIHGFGRHIAEYSNEVEQRFLNVTNRAETLESLQSLKDDLFNGKIAVHSDIRPNA